VRCTPCSPKNGERGAAQGGRRQFASTQIAESDKLLGDHLDAVLSNPSTIVKQLEAGQVRVLAMASDKRSPLLPDIPTFKEQGLDLVDTQWRGLFVKSGTPTEIVSKLDRAFSDAIRTPAFQDYLRR